MKRIHACFVLFVATGLFLSACGGDSTDPCESCSADATCTDKQCICNDGYEGDGVTCTDIDECASDNGGCDTNATCTNEAGSHSCACNTGFEGDGATCTDIDECATDNGGCDENATCANEPGSHTCTCNDGYYGDGETCTPYWTEVMSIPGWYLSSWWYVTGANSRIYIGASTDPNTFKSIDPDTKNIRDETLMPDSSNDFNAAGLTVGLVGTYGMSQEPLIHAFGDYAQEYNCQMKSWYSLGYPDENKRGEVGLVHKDPYVYLVGGRGYAGNELDSLLTYNVLTGDWDTGPSYPVGVNWPAVALVGGTIYATGGRLESGDTNVLLASHTLRSGSWTVLDNAPFENFTRPFGVAYRDQFWVFDGEGWVYDPATSAWLSDPIPRPMGASKWKPVVLTGELYMVGTTSSPSDLTLIVRYTGP